MNIVYTSPIGALLLEFEGEYLTGLTFLSDDTVPKHAVFKPPYSDAAKRCITELDEYFKGVRRTFTVQMELHGTPFRKKVWQALMDIPFGQTCAYKDIAAAVGNPKAMRAVGGANHHNPVSIIVPCHRVIGANGQLTGYGGQLWRKEWLLAHEKKFI